MPVLLDEGAVAKEKLGPPISEPPKNSSHDHLLIFLTQHGIRALFESCRWLEEEERQRGGGKDGQKAKWEIGNEWGRYPLVWPYFLLHQPLLPRAECLRLAYFLSRRL
jgi:hypothetical protein